MILVINVAEKDSFTAKNVNRAIGDGDGDVLNAWAWLIAEVKNGVVGDNRDVHAVKYVFKSIKSFRICVLNSDGQPAAFDWITKP